MQKEQTTRNAKACAQILRHQNPSDELIENVCKGLNVKELHIRTILYSE